MFTINLLTWGKCVSSTYTKLGRWKIEHDVRIINIKIDQANYDNGGGMYFESIENIQKEKKKNEFLVPYCM
jgi:hypothetical protein